MSTKAWMLVGGAMAVAVALAVALVVVIATGDDDDPVAAPQTPLAAGGAGFARPDFDLLEDFQDCLRDHGVQPPDPSEGPRINRTPRKMRRALGACRELLPAPPAGERSLGPFGGPIPQY